jgi:dTDP-3-amino-2,3,6-trideoxy-4-keto-D-glucose/dTDP-3-amino-3,4,6-trideoxy-alpha-D-glucose/dTDP-2,6-dideoxy-D-kanosamine transaminase
MPVKFWDYRPQWEQQRAKMLATIERVFDSGRLILGPEVTRFEERFADYCGVTCGVGVASGTDALFLALKGLGIGVGDEVITVANTAVPTVAAIRATGALPVFVDVCDETGLIDCARIPAVLSSRSRCLLPVHLGGLAADLDALTRLAQEHRLALVEDCAQATGAQYHGARVGSFGAVAAFSFYPTKILGAYGDGGMIITSSPELERKLRRLRFYGMEGNYYAQEEGYNSRLDEVQAALLSLRLEQLDEEVKRRRHLAGRYDAALGGVGDLRLPIVPTGQTHQYYLYTIRTARRDELMSFLTAQGIESRINYPTPIHLMSGYAFLGYPPGSLPVTEQLAGEILSLPLYPELPEVDQDEVIAAMQTFYARRGESR